MSAMRRKRIVETNKNLQFISKLLGAVIEEDKDQPLTCSRCAYHDICYYNHTDDALLIFLKLVREETGGCRAKIFIIKSIIYPTGELIDLLREISGSIGIKEEEKIDMAHTLINLEYEKYEKYKREN